ncbi:hypothetical protein GJ496_001453 [Pomphorhynchus laevis]|nr:hypothetical protein GJ496_001453 [Pomphorhynchus laevis]
MTVGETVERFTAFKYALFSKYGRLDILSYARYDQQSVDFKHNVNNCIFQYIRSFVHNNDNKCIRVEYCAELVFLFLYAVAIDDASSSKHSLELIYHL